VTSGRVATAVALLLALAGCTGETPREGRRFDGAYGGISGGGGAGR
jgi:hypothetical protein